MGFFAWIVVGIVAGFIAEKIMRRRHGLITNLIVGVIGAFVGGFLMSSVFGFQYEQGFNLATIATATIGAIVFLFVLGAVRGRRA